MQKYCVDCHNADNAEGELDLSGLSTLKSMGGGGGSMQRVLEMVRFGAMPPDDSDLPNDEERKTLVSALDQSVYAVSCDSRPRPGKVTARRLNRAEYNRSIRDLFGMDLRPADKFPSDEVGAGFDNNSDVLSMSPMLMEKYLDAAEEVAAKVVIDPDSISKLDEHRPSDQLFVHGDRRVGSFNGLFLKPDGFVWANFDVSLPGEYRVEISGGTSMAETKSTIAAVFDETGTLVGKTTLKYYGGGGESDHVDFKIKLQPGRRRLLVQFFAEDKDGEGNDLEVGRTHRVDFDTLDSHIVAAATKSLEHPLVPDRDFDKSSYPNMIRRISLSGPTELPSHLFPPSQKTIVRKVARRKDDRWYDVESAAVECLRPLMRRAFRGPVSNDEVKPYARLVDEATKRDESYYRGLQIAVSAILVSPRFLFRVEAPPADWKPDSNEPKDAPEPIELTQHQLATRLSYFMWSSLPDETLLKMADEGKLTEKALPQQIKRMLMDEKAEALASEFAAQWLGLRNLTVHEADTQQFKTFTDSLKSSMADETKALFSYVVRENRPVEELLTADYTFVNAELADHYDLPKSDRPEFKGNELTKVSLHGTSRRGVLGHASVLTLTSNPNRTSPVRRGKWILENVLGTPPPDPPAGVPELEDTKTAAAGASLREQLEIHRADPSCAACHRVMDQLGFGLEQFDAIGRFRSEEGGHAIDASGELPGRRSFDGAAQLSDMLGKTEAESFARTVTERLMTFGLGRELSPADRCTVEAIVERTSAKHHTFVDVMTEVIMSRPFRYYDWK